MFQEEGQQLLFMHGPHHVLDIKEAIMDTPLFDESALAFGEKGV
jgi:hypothetical protein